MLGLAIETSTLQGSLALFEVEEKSLPHIATNQARILASQAWYRDRSHGELITSSLENLFMLSGKTLGELSYIALDVGPGSFTGIRVGMNLAKSLSFATGLRIHIASSLDVLIQPVPKDVKRVCAMINAHKSQIYFASYEAGRTSWKTKVKPRALDVLSLQKLLKTKTLCVGDGFYTFKDKLSSAYQNKLIRNSCYSDYPHAENLARWSAMSLKKTDLKSWNDVEPLYIRFSEAEEKLQAGLLKPLPKF